MAAEHKGENLDPNTPIKKAKRLWKAKTLLQVLKETGKIDIKEAHRRCYPDWSEASHAGSAYRDFDEATMAEFAKMIHVDEKAIAELSNKRIVKELLEDLNRINAWLESGDLTVEETCKLTSAKDGKLKMLGMALGMWKSDKPQEAETGDLEALFKKLQSRTQ